MKKLLILAILIASVTVIFALDSEPSEVVGYVKYELIANDFNMIAVPMNSDITTVSELATAIGGDVESLAKWDNSISNWSQFTVGVDVNDFEVPAGTSVLVYLAGTENIDFYCAGDLPSQANYDIVGNDFNQIMVPLNRSELINVSDIAEAIGNIESIATWDNDISNWSQFTVGVDVNDFEISIGDGLLIYATTDNTGWNAPASKNVTRRSARARK